MPIRIGLFGGTFDPVHRGHVSIAESFLNSSFIDELWILLTPFPPHKQGNGHTLYELRQEMLKAAFTGIESIQILTVENELPKPSYTINTIRYLKELYPEKEFYFCMGEDSLTGFHTWKFHEEILEEATLLVADRPEYDRTLVAEYILNKTTFVTHEPLSISSSEIKERIRNKESIETFVPDEVLKLITSQKLYE